MHADIYCIITSGEDALVQFIEKLKSQEQEGPKTEALWSEFSSKWFTLVHSTRPFIFKDVLELADHVKFFSYAPLKYI